MELNGKVLIDGDIIAYRASFATSDFPVSEAIAKTDELLNYVIDDTIVFPTPENYQVYLTGSGNFRYDIAKTAPYKGNRTKAERPIHLTAVREHLTENWGAITSEGEEADDLIAIEATRLGPTTIVASIDKDMLQIPCRHFNFTRKEWSEVNEFEGLHFFYTQILTGDRADNIPGLYRVGPVKAKVILEGCKTEEDLYRAVLDAYDGDVDRVLEAARLLWLRRTEGELWEPPEV